MVAFMDRDVGNVYWHSQSAELIRFLSVYMGKN